MTYLYERLIARLMVRILKSGWGGCDTMDYDGYPDHPRELNAEGRCGSCQAAEVIRWIESNYTNR